MLAAKIRAAADARDEVSRDDLLAAVYPALRHRLILNFQGQAENVPADQLLAAVVEGVAAVVAMAELDHDLLKRLEYLALLAERSGGGPLLDGGRKKLSGDVMEVARRRDYVPGDDYRHIDWAWCARRDELLTRVFERYEDAHFYILLDCSASMGAGRPSKFHLARQAAAALGYLALSRLDRLGVAAFADGLAAELPPLRHKSRFARLLRFLDELVACDRAD